jgi:hypothetical protein
MPINDLVMLVANSDSRWSTQEFRLRAERIEFASGRSAAFGGITVRGSQVGRNAANPQ